MSDVVALLDLEDGKDIDVRSVLLDIFGGTSDPVKKAGRDEGPNATDAQRLAAAAGSQIRSGIVVIWTRRGEAHALSVGGARACVYSHGAVRARYPRAGSARIIAGPEPMALGSGCTLMLCTREAAEALSDRDLEEAIGGLRTSRGACDWLGALLRSRTEGEGRVCLATLPTTRRLGLARPRIGRVQHRGRLAPDAERPTKSPRSLWRFLLSPLAIVALLVAGALIFHRINARLGAPQAQARTSATGTIPRHGAATLALGAPSQLVSRQESGMRMLLAWRTISRATGYVVAIGRHTFRTPRPELVVMGGPRATATYQWRVRALRRNALGPLSRAGTFRVRPIPAIQWTFRALRAPATQLSLAIRNPGSPSARVTIAPLSNRNGQRPTVTIQVGKSLGLRLPLKGPWSKYEGFSIHSSAPILPTRSVRRGHVVSLVYGIPGAGGWLAHS